MKTSEIRKAAVAYAAQCDIRSNVDAFIAGVLWFKSRIITDILTTEEAKTIYKDTAKLDDAKIAFLNTPISETTLTVRAVNVLKCAGCTTMADAFYIEPEELRKYRNCGRKVLEDIYYAFYTHGLIWEKCTN